MSYAVYVYRIATALVDAAALPANQALAGLVAAEEEWPQLVSTVHARAQWASRLSPDKIAPLPPGYPEQPIISAEEAALRSGYSDAGSSSTPSPSPSPQSQALIDAPEVARYGAEEELDQALAEVEGVDPVTALLDGDYQGASLDDILNGL